MNKILILSSPNSRGIHQYAIHLSSIFTDSTIVFPKQPRHLWLLWELFLVPIIILKNKQSHFYLCNSRISPLVLLLPRRTYTLVIHDYIDNIIINSPRSLIRSILSPRRIYHTLLFTIAVHVSSAIVSNSSYTFSESKRLLRSSLPNRIIEPRASFSQFLTQNKSNLARPSCRPRLLIVTGKSQNKSFERYILFLISQLDVLARYKTTITIVGISDSELTPHSASVIQQARRHLEIILCKYMPEQSLIEHYLTAAVFVTLSSSEGFGIPFTDSLNFLIPSIYTRIPPYVNQVATLRHPLPPLYELSNGHDFLVSVCKPQLTDFLSHHLSTPPMNPTQRVSSYLASSTSSNHI